MLIIKIIRHFPKATPPKRRSLDTKMGLNDPRACDFTPSFVLELLYSIYEVSYLGDEVKTIVLQCLSL